MGNRILTLTCERVADLIDLRVIFVRVPIHEKDIGRVRVGDTATVSLDAFPNRTFDGRVKPSPCCNRLDMSCTLTEVTWDHRAQPG